MHYLHDIHVNWVNGDCRAHHIPEYHEWRKSDYVELMDQIPLVFVETEFFTEIENCYFDIPKELLDSVYRTTAWINPNTKRRNKVDYAFVITDGNAVLAVNTEGSKKPSLKSRLIPRQEAIVREIVDGMEPTVYELTPEELELLDDTLGDDILDLRPEYMVGLTRKEKEMKEIVMDCLFNVSCSERRAEVVYWYMELFPEMIGNEKLHTEDLEVLVREMFDFLKVGWSKQHEYFGSLLVKYYDIFKEDWKELTAKETVKNK